MHLEEEAAPLLRAKLFPVLLELYLGDKKAQNTSYGGKLVYPNLDMARILLCRIKSSKLGQCRIIGCPDDTVENSPCEFTAYCVMTEYDYAHPDHNQKCKILSEHKRPYERGDSCLDTVDSR